MNATPTSNPTPSTTARVIAFDFASNPLAPRERDFGIGYGKSSGYASNRRYVNAPVGPRFRVA